MHKYFPIGKRSRKPFPSLLKLRGKAINLVILDEMGYYLPKINYFSHIMRSTKTNSMSFTNSHLKIPKKWHPWIKRVIIQLHQRRENKTQKKKEFWCTFEPNYFYQNNSLLNLAISFEDWEAARCLLDCGADPNLKLENCFSAMEQCIQMQILNKDIPYFIQQKMIQNGAEPIWEDLLNTQQQEQWLAFFEQHLLNKNIILNDTYHTDIPLKTKRL